MRASLPPITLAVGNNRMPSSLPPFNAGPELEPTKVVALSAEDDVTRTIRSRMELAGADLDRVIILEAIRRDEEDPVTLPCDLKHVETVVAKHRA